MSGVTAAGRETVLLGERLAAVAASRGDAPAVVDGTRRLSYAQLLARADALAAELGRRGVGPGDLVAVAIPRSVEFVVAVCGVVRSGAAYLPLDVTHPPARLASVLADAAPRLVVVDGGSPVPRLPGSVAVLALPDDVRPVRVPLPRPAPGDPCYVIYTSGSTGTPKGVVVTQANISRLFTATESWHRFDAADLWTLFHSPAFDYSVWETWGPLTSGGCVLAVGFELTRSPAAFHRLVISAGVTILSQTPTSFRAFLEAHRAAGMPASSLRLLVLAGEPLDPRILRPWIERHGDERPRIVNIYGPTETTVYATFDRISRGDAQGTGVCSIGRPLPDVTLRIVGGDGAPTDRGAAGEIVIGGPGVANGYLGRPDLTASRFSAGPTIGGEPSRRYRTGDLGRWLPDGRIEFLGRADDQVKVRGVRIELGEVEAALRAAPGVADAVAARRERPDGSARLVAYLVPRPGESPDAAAVREFVAERLPEPMVPSAFVAIERIPRTASDKIDRAALPEPTEGDLPRRAPGGAPRTGTERLLAAIWGEVLGVRDVTLADGFVALGGDSILATRVALACDERISAEVSGFDVLRCRDLAELAAFVDAAPRTQARAEPPGAPGRLPLTPGQRAVVFQHELAAGAPVLNESLVLDVEGPFDGPWIAGEVREFLGAHPAFGMRVGGGAAEPHFAASDAAPAVVVADLSSSGEDAIDAALTAAASMPFDLEVGPLARGLVLRVAADRHVVLLCAHHVVVDEWSMALVAEEFAARLRRDGVRPAPDPGPGSFAAERALAAARRAVEDRAFWSGELEGASLDPGLEDTGAADAPEHAGAGAEHALTAEETARLRDALRGAGATEYEAGLAALAAVLEQEAHRPDVTVLTTLADRDRAATANVVGYLLDVLPVRIALDGDPAASDVFRLVRAAVARARAHRSLPLGEALAAAGLTATGAGRGVSVVSYTRREELGTRIRVPGARIAERELPLGVAKFDCSVHLASGPGRLAVRVEHRLRAMSPAAAARLASRVARALVELADAPARRLSELPLLDAGALAAAAAASRGADGPPAPWPSVPSLVARAAAAAPGSPAVAGEGRVVSYAELVAAADALAARLRELAIGPDDVVPVIGRRSAALVASWLGVLRAGAAYAPVDPDQPAARRAAMLEECRPRAVVAAPEFRDGVPAGAPVLGLADTAAPAGAAPAAEPAASSLAYVIFTSGSTGRPKGVEIEHAAFAHFVAWQSRRFAMRPGDRSSFVSGVAFDASVGEVWPVLATGGTVHVPAEDVRTDPERLRDWIVGERLTVAKAPTVLCESLLRLAWPQGTSLRVLHGGGEALRVRPPAGLPFAFVNVYGPTEFTDIATCSVVAPEGRGAPAIGTPVDDAAAYVVDHRGRLCPDGTAGELLLAGPQLARGYRGMPELTARSFPELEVVKGRRERVYRTGDLVRRGGGGELEFLGRRDGQVKLRGVRIETAEVEAALAAHDDVGAAAVVLRDGAAGPHLAAFFEPRAGGRLPVPRELDAWLAARLPRTMIPSRWSVVPALPRSPNGKIDRRRLPASAELPGAAEFAEPATAAERALLPLWRSALRVERCGVDDRFFDLGGHSLLAATLLARVRETFGVALTLRDVFDAPTVRSLARVLDARRAADAGPVPLETRTAELSPGEEGLWFLSRLAPESPVYNVPIAVRLRGPVDAARLGAALRRLADRHEILRTRFPVAEGRARREVDAPGTSAAALVTADVADTAELQRRTAEEARRPFDVERGPLWRATLLRAGPDDATLLLVFHHIAVDERSTRLLLRELGRLYAGTFLDAAPAPVRPASGPVREEHLAFWRRTLEGAPAVVGFPTDFARPAQRSFRGGMHEFRVPPEVAAGLGELARGADATLFVTALAAFVALVARHSGEHDVVVGTPFARRERPGTEDVAGYFLSSLPVRAGVADDPTFRELVRRVRAAVLDAQAHQDCPIEAIVDGLRLARDPAYSPVFQLLFVLSNAGPPSLELPGVAGEARFVATGTSKYDLTMFLAESGGGLDGRIEYATDLFEAETVDRIAARFLVLLRAAAGRPDDRVSALELLPQAERRLVLGDAASPCEIRDVGVHRLVEEEAARRPDATAVVAGGKRLTYAELLAEARRVAAALRALGVGPGDAVALALDRSAEHVTALLGVAMAGGASVPVDPSNPDERRRVIVEDAGARAVVVHAGRQPAWLPGGVVALPLPLPLPLPPGQVLEIGDAPAVRARDPAYVVYTSGSTGRPKGVRVPHRVLVNLVEWQCRESRAGRAARTLQFAPLGFDVSLQEIFATLAGGGELVVVPEELRRDFAGLLRFLDAERVDRIFVPPLALEGLASAFAGTGVRPAALREVVTAGERLRVTPEVVRFLEALGSCALVNQYGPSETHVVSAEALDGPPAAWPALPPIGRPIANARLYVLDAARRPVPVGTPGELCVGGEVVADGYVGRSELTAERFVPDPYAGAEGARMYLTGDRCRRRADGRVEYLGRDDDQVKIRGFRVEPAEVERAIAAHPAVREAAVVACEAASGARSLAAFVAASAALTAGEIELHLERLVPGYMIPGRIAFLDALPRTRNGKTDRRALAALASNPPAEPSSEELDAQERAVAGLFAEVLGVPVASRTADLFRLGGSSLHVARLAMLCETRLAAPVPIARIYERPVVARVAELVRAAQSLAAGPAGPARVPRDAPVPLSPQQRALWLDLELRREPGAYNVAVAFATEAPLDAPRLRAALVRLAERHEVLRSRLVVKDGAPGLAFDRPAGAVELDVLEGRTAGAAADAFRRTASREFDLAAGPLWRCALHVSDDGRTSLLLVVHHLIADAPSLDVLVAGLAAAYDAPESRLAPGAFDFADLAVHESARTASDRDRHLAFFRERLAGADLSPPLPVPCVPCAAGEETRATVARRDLAPDVARRVQATAAGLGATPFHVHLTAFLAVVASYTGTADLVVGIPFSLRDTPASDGVVGYLLSPSVLRARLRCDLPFAANVEIVAAESRGVRDHARLPLDLVLQAVRGPDARRVGSPVQLFFSLAAEPEPPRLGGGSTAPIALAAATATFALSLLVKETPSGTALVVESARGVFDPEMAERFLRHVEHFLDAATSAPAAPLASIPYLGAAEHRRALAASRGPAGPRPPWTLVAERVAAVARATPDAAALVEDGRTVAYAELLSRADAMASRLAAAGIGPGDVVPVVARWSADLVAAWLGVLRAGAAYAPIDADQPPARRLAMIADCGGRVAVTEPEFSRELPPGVAAIDLRPEERSAAAPAARQVPADELAYVVFTSGSTGRPKGVEIPHAALGHVVDWYCSRMRISGSDRIPVLSGTGFDLSVLVAWSTLCAGASLHFVPDEVRLAPARLRDWIAERGITLAFAPTAIAEPLFALEWPETPAFRALSTGGEALRTRPREGAPFELLNFYGPAETAVLATHAAVASSGAGLPEIGAPLSDLAGYVLDAGGRLCPDGVAGELWIAGPQLARGYRGLPERTAEAFRTIEVEPAHAERAYRTGDLVRRRPDGALEFLGRRDGQIKLRGVRIEAAEVEAALLAHPSVASCAVALRGDAAARHLAGYVEPSDPSRPPSPQDLTAHLAARLPRVMIPTRWMFVDEMPQNASGKIDRNALPEIRAAAVTAAADEPRLSDAERLVLRHWRDVLRAPSLAPDDDFFEAGGDSMRAVEILSRVERLAGRRLAAGALIEAPTPRRFAALIAQSSPQPAGLPRGVVVIRPGSDGAPVFCLPGLGSVAFDFRALATRLRTERTVLAVELHDLGADPTVLASVDRTADVVADRIRSVQPSGPYTIAGYSYGGLLAFEVARRLGDAASPSDTIAVLDAYVPGTLKPPGPIGKIGRHLRILGRSSLRERWEYLSSRVLRRLGLARPGEAPKPAPASDIERRIQETSDLCLRAFRDYRPGRYAGRLTLVKATDLGDWMEADDPTGTCGWSSVCSGGVEVVAMSCRHLDLFREPYIGELAARLDALLAPERGRE